MTVSDTEREQLTKIRTNLLDRLQDLTGELKPNYAVDGERYDWGDLLRQYGDEAARAEELLAADGPFEIRSQGAT